MIRRNTTVGRSSADNRQLSSRVDEIPGCLNLVQGATQDKAAREFRLRLVVSP